MRREMGATAPYRKIVIGIDQSYKNTGISVAADGKLKDIKSVRLDGKKNNSERRRALGDKLDGLLKVVANKADSVEVIIERIRLHSGVQQSFVNIDYIKSIGALNATVVDVCHHYGIAVSSVDTRCWKSQVVGTSKPQSNRYGVPPEKWPTVRWVIHNGFRDKILVEITTRKVKGTFVKNGRRFMYNDDASDSAGIAMFGFVGDRSKLHPER